MPSETKKILSDVAEILNRAGWGDRGVMGDAHKLKVIDSIEIGGHVINSQVGQTLTNCTNLVREQAPGERKALLETLNANVGKLIESLPEDKMDEAPQVAEDLEMMVRQASSEKPNRKWYSVSAEGLLNAAKWVEDFTADIGGTILRLGKLLWPDYQLPDAK